MWLLWILAFISSLTHSGTNQPFAFDNQSILEFHVFSKGEVIFDSCRKEVVILWQPSLMTGSDSVAVLITFCVV